MDDLQILKTTNVFELCKGPFDRLFHMEVVTGGVCMTGVKTDSNPFFLLDTVKYLTDLLKLRTHTVTRARHIFQTDLELSLCMLGSLVEGVADSLESDLSSHSQMAAEVCD